MPNEIEKYKKGNHWESHSLVYAKRFLNFLKRKKFPGLLVDFGCGNGRDVNYFNKNGIRSIGINNSKKEIKTARKKFPAYDFKIQDIENLNFRDESIEAGFMINVIHYLDQEEAIKEILRVLNKSAYFFIHFNIEIKDERGKVDYSFDEESILDLIKEFKIIKKKIFKRIDKKPQEHTHKIMELILQK